MNKQMTMSLISDELRQAATPKKELLERMDRIIPWSRWIELVLPYYYKGEHGNKPYPLERMLRIYVIQNLYNLADMAAKNEIIDSRAALGRYQTTSVSNTMVTLAVCPVFSSPVSAPKTPGSSVARGW